MPGAPAETPYRWFSMLGMVASGDLGSLTCYRSHLGKIVVFSKTWPIKWPTLSQLTGRARMYFGAEQWRGFTDYQKHTWRQTAETSSLTMTGYNLWIRWWMNPSWGTFITLKNQTGIDTLKCISRHPPEIPTPLKFEPLLLSDDYPRGYLRYGRKHVVVPYSTTEYLPFLCYNPDFLRGTEIPSWWTLYGKGTIDHPRVYNKQWCCLRYTSPNEHEQATVELHSEWSDGREDTCQVAISTDPI